MKAWTSNSSSRYWVVVVLAVMLNEAKTLRPRPKLRGRGPGQSFKVEAEAKILSSRPLWPRGHNITGY